MLIQCTKALLNQIGIKHSELASSGDYEQFPSSFMSWHANFVSLDKGKAIILMNNETRYPIVIYKPKKKDLFKIKELICEAISVALRMEGVRKEVIETYMAKAGEISFSQTSGRSMVAKMNNAVREIGFMQEFLDEETTIQRYISIAAGRLIQGSGTNEYFYPYEKMLQCLGIVALNKSEAVDEVLDVELYQLKIQINLEGHDIWRRVLVPSTYSFRHLHHIIQTVFDWQNYHLHEFVVGRGENERLLQIVMDDDPETMEFVNFDNVEIRKEQFVALEDIFPKYNVVSYEYDFGDSWEHTITLEKVVKSKSFQATYIDGNGERPPEDVGGAPGFEEYLSLIENKKHPMHHEMKAWAENQKERKFSPEKIDQRLKRTISGYSYSPFSC
ncbi:hypothetical protein DCC39_15985 [Pueribacillus theae]|uniref:Uncharacterized protein n=1 Tax=Pueribacillus theae TaxID=2171751 RepID=A0A2U1JRR7_9BACI|nr:plasmid pRiA4b ORF-3 family protein [Pueribacillus theae]PWA07900.1 hypothetical protein DCC39_15985 [Pueribacillus theae]